ncbi:ATP synthase F0 subunit C [bacterium]|nr:ATP synthase F0 subunit C [bacterium]MBQ5492624.1 ATP synthase F0 subunit C [Mycoplasmataceae bacterium]MBQ5500991.1 ATP synthase F0 subunit C [Mycoplasmataceae bacterium]
MLLPDLNTLLDIKQSASNLIADSHHIIHHSDTIVLADDARRSAKDANPAARAGCYIGAGLAMTGALGVGFGQGYVGGKAALAVAKNPDEYSRIRTMMLIGAAIAESSAIYALIIAILLIFVAPNL